MPWDVNEGVVQLGESGNPLWIPEGENGEAAGDATEVDWSSALSTIERLNGESKDRRETAEGLQTTVDDLTGQLGLFKDLDPAAAREAITKMANIDQGALLTADKVESFKASILEAAEGEKTRLVDDFTEKVMTTETERDEALVKIKQLVIGNSFAGSDYVKKLTAPLDMVENTFSSYFKVEEDLPVAYLNGNRVNSRQRPGENATFDEALEIIIDQYPHKHMLFPGNPGGSGGPGGGGGGGSASAEEIRNMNIAEYAQAKKDGRINPAAA